MNGPKFSWLVHGLRWLCIAIIVVATLAACGPNPPSNPAGNEGNVNQNSGN